MMKKPVVLCILDGWGWRDERENNAPALAHTPHFDRGWATCPRGFLWACEEQVGLPKGQIGNSEVGHMNLGAGRIVLQDLPRIDDALKTGALAQHDVLRGLAVTLQKTGGVAHLLGLASPGGVHSHEDHIIGIAKILHHLGVKVVVHAWLDGRDVPPRQAMETLGNFKKKIDELSATLGTLCGRYYAMDRDQRWERVALAYDVMVDGAGQRTHDWQRAMEESYANGVTDEFIKPLVLGEYEGMKDGDAIVCANFRSDRVREILAALLDPQFDGFERKKVIQFADAVGMYDYSDHLKQFLKTLFPPKRITQSLGEVVAHAGKKQLRLAETEKYPHVTFFFNGGEETVFAGEDRVMVPSPKVATYDLQPEMSAAEVTQKVVVAIESQQYDFIMINFANPDMVGHTGSLPAAIKACEAVDAGLGRMLEALSTVGGTAFVTADHGNCEMMVDPATGGPHTAHTLNKVPAFLFNGPADVKSLREGVLADVAPTILALMKIAQPAVMTGKSLLQETA